ncbi:hypothetical protein K438DRAFT_1631977, partial [Mycena galopus ATCC 62051]
LMGSALQIPQNFEWSTLSKWARKYGSHSQYNEYQGDIVYLEVFGQPLIVLNGRKVAKDLLEQAIYSDRPHLVSHINPV